MQLRPYQIEAIEKLRTSIAKGNKRIILCAPTGAGKTVIFSEMCYQAGEKNKRVMILTDRFELLTQSGGALNRLKILPEYIQASTSYINKYWIYVAMIETLHRRLAKPEYLTLLQTVDLLIIDEAHKAVFDKLFPMLNENTIVIGATATPYRQGKQESLDKYYTDLVEVTTVQSLIDAKYLAQPTYYGMPIDLQGVKMKGGDYDTESLAQMYSTRQVYKGVAKEYLNHAKGKKAILFASNIESSIEVCAELQAYGIPTMHIDASCKPVERRNVLNWYKVTPNAVLCNVGLFTTGFDEPSTECIILYRATKSLPLYLQMAKSLSVTSGDIEASLSLYYWGLTSTRLLYGSLAHYFSAKKMLVFGLSLFVLGGIICAVSESLSVLLIGRFIEGMGMSAPGVLGVPLIYHLYENETTKKIKYVSYLGMVQKQ